MIDAPDGLALLSRMAEAWPFFDDLLSKIEMALGKADLDIARLYVSRLGEHPAVFADLEQEFHRCAAAVLAIRKTRRLLEGQRVLQTAIELRNPYVDPLSVLQVSLLGRKRSLAPEAPEAATLEDAVAATIHGIAQAMRNTG
jgi:phosphoenolpyruvate carboxylase